MATQIWHMLAEERTRAADYFATLSEGDLNKQSLCPDWTVRDIVAHIYSGTIMNPPRFMIGLVSSGFNFNKLMQKGVDKHNSKPAADLIAGIRANAQRHTIPGKPMVGEAMLHTEDARVALTGELGAHDIEHVRLVADYYKTLGGFMGVKDRIEGITLSATDDKWTWGSGPKVAGPLLSILFAMVGRSARLQDLSGDGMDTLKSRL